VSGPIGKKAPGNMVIITKGQYRKSMKNQTPKIGRNAPCPCGSGRKYKKCCLGSETASSRERDRDYAQKHNIRLKTPAQVEGIKRAGALVMETLEGVARKIRPGLVTDEINTFVHDFTVKNGAQPAPLNYHGYPKSVCVSVNEVICHGIPGDRVLMEGDIVNVDVTSILDGYYADCNQTFFVGTPSGEARKIVGVACQSLKKGMEMVKPGNRIGDIGWAIQKYAEERGCSVVREFVGHGVGLDFHEKPQIPHFGRRGQGLRLVPGMVFTIEPMINLGSHTLRILRDEWTAVTKDSSLSAQFEQTLLVTPEGFESLTPFNLDIYPD
jgi:methionyl aminopeptidase